ncbi:MAG TPA: hypothetical protein PK082_01830 [Phycisphaerae bacterium]|nr:hypothetical protein [Phycisphaerae bacterium]
MLAELGQHLLGAGGVLAGGRPHLDADFFRLLRPVQRFFGAGGEFPVIFEDLAHEFSLSGCGSARVATMTFYPLPARESKWSGRNFAFPAPGGRHFGFARRADNADSNSGRSPRPDGIAGFSRTIR